MERKWEISLEVINLSGNRTGTGGRDRSYQGRIRKIWHLLDAGLKEQEPEMPWRFPISANKKMMEAFPERVTYVRR